MDPSRGQGETGEESEVDSGSGEATAQPAPPRILALDVGSRRIGIAITDALGYIVQPLLTLYRKTPHADLKSIGRLLRRYGVAEIVVGNPLHMSGEPSAQAARTRRFADDLRAGFALPVHLWDERLTTADAHAQLDRLHGSRSGAGDRRQRSAIVDQMAAVLILESFLAEREYREAAARLRAGEGG